MTDIKKVSSQFETCQIILDKEGKLLSFPPSLYIWTGDNNLKSQSLFYLLEKLNPYWLELLPTNISELQTPLFLPWGNGSSEQPYGIELHHTICDEKTFITLSPALSPHDNLKKQFLGDLTPDPKVLLQIALRLQTAESRLDNYVKNFPGVFFFQRPDCSFSYLSSGAKDLLNTPNNSLSKTGTKFLSLIFDEDRKRFLSSLTEQSKKGKTFSQTYRLQIPERNNVLYILDVRTPLITPQGVLIGYEGVWLDVTRQSIAENKLSDAVWKEGLATITNGLVHDFSNLMGGIYSLSEMYFNSISEDDPMHEGMMHIKKSSMQAQKLVRRIIDLHKDSKNQREIHNLNHLIKDQAELVEVILPKYNKLNIQVPDESLPVFIDEVLFRQVILNMALNSRDAMDEKGEITISAEPIEPNVTIFQNTFGGEISTSKKGVLISISDNGCGISRHNLHNIFNPFFTTKEKDQGSGFGLYNVKLFVQDNDGLLDVYSEEGVGTTFYLFLPLANI